MKKRIILSMVAGLLFSNAAQAGLSGIVYYPANVESANPAFMIGIAVEFGDDIKKADVGLTAKVISSDRPNTAVIGAGISFFPWSKDQFGADIGVGYNFNGVGALAGYDFLRSKPQVSFGYVATNDRSYFCDDPTHVLDGSTCSYSDIIESDRRVKRDIQLVEVLDNGMKVYSFKYNWSDQTYVGVMAQDLLEDPRWAKAVIIREDGYYAVDYERLNLRMTTLAEWNQNGRYAVARYFIHGESILN